MTSPAHAREQEPHATWTKSGLVVTSDGDGRISEIEEQSKVHAGEPGAFSLFGFAVGTLIIAIPISGFVPLDPGVLATIAPVLVFAGIAQFIGGLVALGRADTFPGTAFCAYGANNVVVATYFLLQSAGVFPPDMLATNIALGVELLCFAYISLVLGFAALSENWVFVTILWFLVPGFGLAAIPNIGGSAGIGHIGGYFLIGSAGFAFYAASALVLNSSMQRQVLPLLGRQ